MTRTLTPQRPYRSFTRNERAKLNKRHNVSTDSQTTDPMRRTDKVRANEWK